MQSSLFIPMKQRNVFRKTKKRKSKLLWLYGICALLVLLIFMTAIIALLTGWFGTVKNDREETLPPTVNRFTCPSFSNTGFSVPSGSNDYGFVVCVDTDEDQMYYFTGQTGLQTFAKLNTSDPNNVFQDGPNLAPGGILPGGIDTVIGCVYNPVIGQFLITDWTCENLYALDKTGSSATLLSSSLSFACVRGLTLVENNTQLFGTGSQSNEVYSMDPLNGNLLQTWNFQADTMFSTIAFNAITYDSSTLEFYAIYKNEDAEINALADLGRLNFNTSTVESTCVSESYHSISSLAITEDGRYFMGSGKRDRFQLYTLSSAPTPENALVAENWILQCSDDVLNLTLGDAITIDHNFEVVGEACGTPQLFDGSDSPAGFIPIVAKRSEETSYIMHPNQEMAAELVVEGTHHIESIQPILVTNETGVQKRQIPIEPPLYPFATSSGTPIVISGGQGDYQQLSSRGPLLTDSAIQRYNTLTTSLSIQDTSVFVSVILTDIAPANCQIPFPRFHYFWWDGEADRWISVWLPTTRDRVCMAYSTTIDPLGAYSFWEFPFVGQQIDRMDFTIWGDYYLASWNDLNQPLATREANLFVFERNRILFGGGTPRVLSLPRPTIVATDGKRATAVPHRQPNNNGPRGPMNTAFPCGIWTVMTPGAINMQMCQSINFDTSMITTTESMTIIPIYNDGSAGNCTSEVACIPSGNPPLEHNPFRYEPRIAYRHFPNSGGMERFVIAITVDADGTNNAKIFIGSFIHQLNGTLTVEREMHTPNLRIDSDFVEHNWNPILELSPNNYLLLFSTGTISTNIGITQVSNFQHFAFDSQLQFMYPRFSSQGNAANNVEAEQPKRYIQSRPDKQASFAISSILRTTNTFNFWREINSQAYRSKGIAIDDCNKTATCFREFTYNVRESLPLPPSA